MKLKHLIASAILLPMVGTQAQDIEIYSEIGGTTEDNNPNLLFVLDTSGSMDRNIPVAFGDYDSQVDYGNSDDDLVYVYDENFTYQGVFYNRQEIVCESMLDFLDSNQSLPVYTGQTLQWREESDASADASVCPFDVNMSSTESFNQEITRVGNQNVVYQITIPNADLVPGTRVEVFLENTGNRTADIELGYWYDNNGSARAVNTCDVDVTGGNSGGCIGNSGIDVDDIPATVNAQGATRTVLGVRIRIEANNNDQATTIVGSVNYNVGLNGQDPACVAANGATTSVQNWTNDLFIPNNSSSEVLECEGDSGVHGVNDSSLDLFVTFCADNSCTEPRYTQNESAEVDWRENSIQPFTFVTANFRDYLESEFTNPEGNIGDPEAFCDNNNNAGRFIQDSEGEAVFQCQHKGEIMVQAARDMASTLNGVNLGLMRFYDPSLDPNDNRDGGSVILAVDAIDASTEGEAHRQSVLNTLNVIYNEDQGGNNNEFNGHTPLAETLYEAHRYYSGQSPLTGQSNTDSAALAGSGNSQTYVSPIESSCQSNNIIYLTDGEPFSDGDNSIEDPIRALLGQFDPSVIADRGCSFDDFAGDSDGDNCMDEMAEVMANFDHVTRELRSTADGSLENRVNLFTIGFDIDLPLLLDAAEKGNGEYYIASDYLELQRAFQNILVEVALSAPSALVAPAVSVNAFNELQHRSDLYYAVFEPASSPKWEGNVKKYRISGGEVLDANDAPAINAQTGFFNTNAQSIWSDVVDAANVPVGGIREQFTEDRNIFVDGSVLANAPLGANIIRLEDDAELSLAATGAVSTEEAERIRDWILGEDVSDVNNNGSIGDAHQYAADTLHARPFVVTYEGTSEADARDVLFVPTNQGFLHAVDARDEQGTELWAYIPPDLVDNSRGYLNNNENDSHIYGLDGESTVLTVEAADSTPEDFSLETVQIFQGMRRGGRNYYAWDVSDALSTTGTPIDTMWTINGGSGDFADLGQTWSRMVRTQISYDCSEEGVGCTTEDVLVFTGGYDTFYDDPDSLPHTGSSSVTGNAIYIVDLDGNLLWSAGDNNSHDLNLDMYNSFPASPTPIDIDGDGAMDVLFAIDISGKIWRVDFNQAASSPSAAGNIEDRFAQGGMIADLSTSDPRRFYNALDISVSAPRGENPYLNLVVGSGYRAHPRDTDEGANAIFVIYDENIFEPLDVNEDGIYEYGYLASGDTVSFANGDLFQVTSGVLAERGVNAIFGFYIPLAENDEKILQSTTTFNGRVTLASYIPDGGAQQSDDELCGAGSIGGGSAYVFDLETGALLFTEELSSDGIPPEATFLLTDAGLTICFGTECWAGSGSGDADDGDGDDGFNSEDTNCITPFNLVDAQCLVPNRAYRTYWREDQ